MRIIRATAAIVLLCLVTACAKNLPPTLDTRFVGKASTQRTQSVPNTYGLIMYSMGVAALKNMLAVLDVANSHWAPTTGLPSCLNISPAASGNQIVYTINLQSNCPPIDNWAPPNITATIDSNSNLTKVTYDSRNATTPPISLQIKPNAQGSAGIHTLSIYNENISLTTETATGGGLEQGLFSFNYSGTIHYSVQYQNSNNGQSQNGSTIDHAANVQIVGQLDMRKSAPAIALQTFQISQYKALINNQVQVSGSSLSLSTPPSGFAQLADGVPVEKMAFNQTLVFPNTTTQPKPSPVTIKSLAGQAQIEEQGSSASVFYDSGASNTDRMVDIFNTVLAAVAKIRN